MNTKPIIFKTEMIRALLDGRESMTRRIVKPQPELPGYWPTKKDSGFHWASEDHFRKGGIYHCPYGQPGDMLIPTMMIPSLRNCYCADINGNIWSKASGEWKKLKGSPTSKGYLSITPAVGGKYKTELVHKLVCETFYGPAPNGLLQVRHLDGNQLNNAPDNLDWGSQEQNWTDRAFHGRGMGEDHHASKLTDQAVLDIRESRDSQRVLSKKHNVSQSQIWAVLNKKTWDPDRQQDPPNFKRRFNSLTLRITNVRVERVQEITGRDAAAEGCQLKHWITGEYPAIDHGIEAEGKVLIRKFKDLWNSIHGPDAWDRNDWVWVIEFEVIKQNVDEAIND